MSHSDSTTAVTTETATVETPLSLDEKLKRELGTIELDTLTSTYLSDLVRGTVNVVGQARGTFVAHNGDRCFHASLHAALKAQGHLR